MEKSVVRPGCRVVYNTYGDRANPAVVLLHGYGVDARMWEPQLSALNGYYVIVPDVRGHGRSCPCGEFSIPAAADDVKAILEGEGCADFVLVGLSMGGYITQEYAFRHGEARGYFIVGATPIFLDCYSGFERWMLRHSAQMLNLYPWETLKKAMTKACAITKAGRSAVAVMFDAMSKPEFIKSWQGVAACLHTEDMRFDAPLLVACGDSDRTGTIRKCLGKWEPVYGCRTLVFQDAAHVANIDTPLAFNETMLDFILRCEDGCRSSR